MKAEKLCIICGKPTTTSRKGRCQRCYMQYYKGCETDSSCEACDMGDMRFLTRRRLDGVNWTTLCGNCAILAGKRKITLEDLKTELYPDGDRRASERRTSTKRRFKDNRTDERRIYSNLQRADSERRDNDRRTG